MKKFLVAAFASLAMICGGAFAVPSVQQIESTMSQGNWQQADAGLTQVLEAHPNNAHAHYLYGQVLEREGRYGDALAQVEQAKSLDPQIRFTTPSRFAQVEARIRASAQRAGSVTTRRADNPFVQQAAPAQTPPPGTFSAVPVKHGPSMGMWIGIAVLLVAIALVLRWTVRRAKSSEDTRANDDRRVQLKRATDLLNEVRSLKLDVRLSTAPGHEALEKDVEATEAQLRERVEALSNASNPVPPYEIEALERQVASLKARAEGRPDPNAQTAQTAASGDRTGESVFAREADERFGRGQQPGYGQQGPWPAPPPQQQPPVIIQQGGGGFGGGMGGLLTGVLLGEALNSGRDRVVERDVIVDDERRRREADNGGGVDFGQGSNDWNDDSSGGNVDLGNDDSGGWNDT
ncbi:tetratricopeptide repeat protein [Paraburkholderia sp. SUR17]|uniref:tetratricopeptide repeat protein n=1 Tax=Paraburkholderia sp. SUR17 TaxID=3034358 RepID=UPI0024083A7E|nr:tetratricopeptide repeat protein [Paraburkholderia sp. SUR17]WEY40265.1 tetratricopeptide repeat protein [Paraburkholderia sp. SUR17]